MQNTKSLNTTESKNRFRFEKYSKRLQKVNIDVIHSYKGEGLLNESLSKLPKTSSGCYFQEELERSKELYKGSIFKRFYYNCYPLCQSLLELLHHKYTIIEMITTAISEVPLVDLQCFFQLCSVLGRDLQGDMGEHIHR